MATSPRRRETTGGGLYLAVTIAALIVTVYFVFLMIGILFKLAFLILAAVIARAAWRAHRSQP